MCAGSWHKVYRQADILTTMRTIFDEERCEAHRESMATILAMQDLVSRNLYVPFLLRVLWKSFTQLQYSYRTRSEDECRKPIVCTACLSIDSNVFLASIARLAE